jgi:hypothetical protein
MADMPPILSTEMQHFRSVNTAIFIQNIFHNFALILQGFLSGFALFHTIMAFSFSDVASLVKGYSQMAAPMRAAFYFCFVISAIDAMDRQVRFCLFLMEFCLDLKLAELGVKH